MFASFVRVSKSLDFWRISQKDKCQGECYIKIRNETKEVWCKSRRGAVTQRVKGTEEVGL